jgi:PST family polysaccharide transporter
MADPVVSEQESFQALKKKSLNSIGTLICRQFVTKIIYLVANIVLARMLAPQVFGVFAIVSFVVQFFSVFGDVGIGAALIQKKDELSREELSTIFWLQQLLVWIVAAIAIAAAPLALKFYPTLPPVGVWLIRAMAFGFILSSLKTVPAILMERNIDFNRIALIDVTESLSFHGAAIAFALAGYDVWSFVWAAVIRSVLGVAVVYSISSWRPGFYFNFDSIRGLLGFGLPYQGNNILAFFKDTVTPVFVGSYSGAAAVGYVNWARNFAFAPLMISEVFGKVAFPSFSRIQTDRELLARTIERSIRMMTTVLFPVSALMIALGPQLIHVLFTDKWLPAIRAYYFYCTSPLVIGFMLPMHSALLSLGRSLLLFRVMLLLIVFEWGFGSLFVVLYGYNGIAFNQPIIALIFTLLYKKALRSDGVAVLVIRNIRCQALAAFLSGLIAWYIINQLAASIVNIFLVATIGITIYILGLLVINKRTISEFIEYILQVLSVKQA